MLCTYREFVQHIGGILCIPTFFKRFTYRIFAIPQLWNGYSIAVE